MHDVSMSVNEKTGWLGFVTISEKYCIRSVVHSFESIVKPAQQLRACDKHSLAHSRVDGQTIDESIRGNTKGTNA